MTDLAKQNYELAFHISSNLDEADVQKTRQELEKYITSHGGSVSFVKEPERIRLAYSIDHQNNAFFGYFNFNLESPESVSQINDELRLNPNILRYMVLKLEPESAKKKEDAVRRLVALERRKAKAAKQDKQTHKSDAPKVEEKVLDEKLEEIIGKL